MTPSRRQLLQGIAAIAVDPSRAPGASWCEEPIVVHVEVWPEDDDWWPYDLVTGEA